MAMPCVTRDRLFGYLPINAGNRGFPRESTLKASWSKEATAMADAQVVAPPIHILGDEMGRRQRRVLASEDLVPPERENSSLLRTWPLRGARPLTFRALSRGKMREGMP